MKHMNNGKQVERMIGDLPEGKKIEVVLGFDYGTQNIGVAVGNALTQTAQPVTILKARHEQPNWEEVEALIKEWLPDAFVVGIPYTKDGTETEHIRKIRKFMNRLHGRFGLPAVEVDESRTSLESEAFLRPSQRHKKGQLDAISAAIIVERWLNRDTFMPSL